MGNTNSRFVQDINRLVKARKENKGALPAIQVAPIGAVRGIGEANKPPATSSEGIASPLKEIPGTREYYEPQLMRSSDGLFVIEQQVLKRAAFKDANGNELIIDFSEHIA